MDTRQLGTARPAPPSASIGASRHPWGRALLVGLAVVGTLVGGAQSASAGLVVNYAVAATGQTATADFTFTDSDTLVVVLTETTPAGGSSLTGPGAVLTRLGFHLPSGQIGGGSVAVGAGSASVGFSFVNPQLGGGANVSTEWGYSQGPKSIGNTGGPLSEALQVKSLSLLQQTNDVLSQADDFAALGAEKKTLAKAKRDAAAAILSSNPDPQMKADAAELIKSAEQDEAAVANFKAQEDEARAKAAGLAAQATALLQQSAGPLTYDFVGVLEDLTTPFETVPPGGNLDDVDGLGGVRAGLLADSDARDGLGIIDDTVIITLQLTDALDALEQDAFLRDLLTDSVIQYGPGGGYGVSSPFAVSLPTTVPEPASFVLLATGLATLRAIARRRAKIA